MLIPDISMTATPIYGFSWGATNSGSLGTGGGGGAGTVLFNDVSFTKQTDATSPELLIDTATGKHVRMAQITIFQPGTTTAQAVYEFSDVIFTAFENAPNAAGTPMETIKLNFSRVVFRGECFDLKLNAKC